MITAVKDSGLRCERGCVRDGAWFLDRWMHAVFVREVICDRCKQKESGEQERVTVKMRSNRGVME